MIPQPQFWNPYTTLPTVRLCGRQTFYRTNYYLYGLINIVERKRFSVTKKKATALSLSTSNSLEDVWTD
jgi:hypothetical protein